MQKKLDNLNSGIQENITNVRVIKSFVRQDFETEKFENANSDLMNTDNESLENRYNDNADYDVGNEYNNIACGMVRR